MRLGPLLYLARYYLEVRLLGRKRPIIGGIKLSHRCNLRCQQCPYWRRPQDTLSYEQVLDIFRHMYALGVRVMILEGGEPMLWRDGPYTVEDLVRKAKELFFTVGMTTNGTQGFETEADIVWVSVDGLRETHNQFRSNSFDQIVNNLRISNHKNIFANITISKANYQEVPQLIKFLSPYVKGITIQFFYPYPESEDLLLSWAERGLILEQLLHLKAGGYPLVDSRVVLKRLKHNSWRCEPWMFANANPDGEILQGCYLQHRDTNTEPCRLCGFAAHAEASMALQLHPGAIQAGRRILKIF